MEDKKMKDVSDTSHIAIVLTLWGQAFTRNLLLYRQYMHASPRDAHPVNTLGSLRLISTVYIYIHACRHCRIECQLNRFLCHAPQSWEHGVMTQQFTDAIFSLHAEPTAEAYEAWSYRYS